MSGKRKRPRDDGQHDDNSFDELYEKALRSAQLAGQRAGHRPIAAPSHFLRHALTLHHWLRQGGSEVARDGDHSGSGDHSERSIFEPRRHKVRRLYLEFCIQFNSESLPLNSYERRDSMATSAFSSVEHLHAQARFPPCLVESQSVLFNPEWYTSYRWKFASKLSSELASAAQSAASAVHRATHYSSWEELPRADSASL